MVGRLLREREIERESKRESESEREVKKERECTYVGLCVACVRVHPAK